MTEVLFLSAGLLIGGTIAWFLGRAQASSGYLGEVRDLESRLNAEKEARIVAEERLKGQETALEEANSRLRESFDALASNALKSNNQAFMDLAKQTMEGYINQSKGDLGKKQEAIELMLKPFKESLDKHEGLVKALGESSRETFGSLKEYLNQLKASQESLEKETGALVTALKSPKVRGRWGEIGLKRVVEFSGMTAYCDFVEQQSIPTEESRLQPDLTVTLPGERSIIVDSKVPLNAYLEAVESEDETARKVLLTKHAQAVRTHMKDLGSKQYWSALDDTVDFVVLYIEIESAFAAAMIEDRELILDAIRNRVIFATPTTLITLLKTVAYSWKQQAVADNAVRIWNTGRDLFERLCVFTEHLQGMEKGITTAMKSYNSAVGSWETRVAPGIRKLERLGASSGKKELPTLEEIELVSREVKSLEINEADAPVRGD